jgi:hypothetical protein
MPEARQLARGCADGPVRIVPCHAEHELFYGRRGPCPTGSALRRGLLGETARRRDGLRQGYRKNPVARGFSLASPGRLRLRPAGPELASARAPEAEAAPGARSALDGDSHRSPARPRSRLRVHGDRPAGGERGSAARRGAAGRPVRTWHTAPNRTPLPPVDERQAGRGAGSIKAGPTLPPVHRGIEERNGRCRSADRPDTPAAAAAAAAAAPLRRALRC